jgi:hypothetical protein
VTYSTARQGAEGVSQMASPTGLRCAAGVLDELAAQARAHEAATAR